MESKRFKSPKSILFIILATLLVLSLSGVAVFASEPDLQVKEEPFGESELFVPGEIIVKFNPGMPHEIIDKINSKYNVSKIERSPWGFMRLAIPSGKSVGEMVHVYSNNPNVEYVQPNSICRAVGEPNDPYYSYQWHMDNDEYGGINMEGAWELSTGSGVVVAVLDTGVAYEDYGIYKQAPDLASTNFVAGYDFINNDSHPNDDQSHGTHVAGTIAQSTNNAIGVAGVAFNASIMPVKVLDNEGSGTAASLANGIYFATDQGADVINMSLAWPWWRGSMYDPGPVVHNAVIYAYNHGVTIVAAAGNDRKSEVAYPAAYEECIAVGATQYDESLAPYTNKGTALDLTAPGGNTGVDQNNDGYGDGVLQQTFNPSTKDLDDFGYWFFQGTSMATPHVAGVAALVIASGITGPDNVRYVLESTAEDHGTSGWDQEYGYGIVDAYAALLSVASPNNPPTAYAGGPYTGTEDMAIIFDGSSSTDPDGDELTYSWDFGDGNTGSGVNPTHTYEWGGTFSVTLTVSDSKGGIDTDVTAATISEVNDVPVADPNGPYSGVAGETITFDGSGSSDFDNQDGTIDNDQTLNYSWDFGDGFTGTGVNPTHAYSAVGDYTVTLVVNDGITDSSSATANVTISETAADTMHIGDLDGEGVKLQRGNWKGVVTVTVHDSAENPVSGAVVTGTFYQNGTYVKGVSGTTNETGVVILDSNQFPSKEGKATFVVDNVTHAALNYDLASNHDPDGDSDGTTIVISK